MKKIKKFIIEADSKDIKYRDEQKTPPRSTSLKISNIH